MRGTERERDGSRPRSSLPSRIAGWWTGLRDSTLLAGSCLALLAVHLTIALRVAYPTIYGDEPGYLGNAHHLLFGTGATGGGYYPGYSLFLIPADLLTRSPLAYYRAALVTNAVLAVISLPLLVALLRRVLPARSFREVLVAAVLTTLLPALLVGSAWVMSEAVTVPLFIGIAVLVFDAANPLRGGRLRWLAAGALVGYATWVNPRGAYFVPAFLLGLLVACRPLRQHLGNIASATIALVVAAGVGRLLVQTLPGTGRYAGADPMLGPIRDAFSVEGFRHALSRLFGTGFYVTGATLGAALVGVVVAVGWIFKGGTPDVARRSTAIFVAGTFATVWWVGAVREVPFLARFDYALYGRYVENVFAPVAAIGFAVLFQRSPASWPRLSRWSWILVPAVIIAMSQLAERLRPVFFSLGPALVSVWFNISSLWIYHRFASGLSITTFGWYMAAACLVALGSLRLDVRLGRTVFFVVVCVSSYFVFTGYVVPGAEQSAHRQHYHDLFRVARARGYDLKCVSYDPGALGLATQAIGSEIAFNNPDVQLRPVGSGSRELPCRTLLLTTSTSTRPSPSAQLLSTESGLKLWYVPDR